MFILIFVKLHYTSRMRKVEAKIKKKIIIRKIYFNSTHSFVLSINHNFNL